MPTIDYDAKEVLLRFGAVGPAGAGKTQILWRLHADLPQEMRGELVMRPIGADLLVSFDFVPPDLVPIADYRARCQLVAIAGRITEPAVLQRVMNDLDGILFVADSQCERAEENLEALRKVASLPGLADVPMVFLYNKRDLPNAAPMEYLDQILNRLGVPRFGTVAVTGVGLAAAISELSRLVLR